MAGGGGKRHCALTETQMARLIGGDRRGDGDGAKTVINRTKVVRQGSETEAELARQQWRALSSVAACGGGEGGKLEWQSACGGQQGALHFKPANARHGQGEQGAWRPCSDDGLMPVGHGRV